MIYIDGLHRAYRDTMHCLISIRELRHLFEPSYFSSDEIEPSQRPKWLAHFVGALTTAHGHATEMCNLLRPQFAEAAGGLIMFCGIRADSLHMAVVALGAKILGYINESWDGDANAPFIPPTTMYKLGDAFRPIDPTELWSHTRLEQEYLAARRCKPIGHGPRTRGELAADILSELRPFRTQPLPSAPLENIASGFEVSSQPPPVYYDSHEGRLDETWVWRVLAPLQSCRIAREAAEQFNAVVTRVKETGQTLAALRHGANATISPELLVEAKTSHQAAMRELYESLLQAVLSNGDEDMAAPLAPVEHDEKEFSRLGLSREHMPLSGSERHGRGPGNICYSLGAGWSWGQNLLPDVAGDDLQHAHFDVMQLAGKLPGDDLTDGFYLSGSDTDESNMHDPARIIGMIESLGYAYWRAKYRMAIVGREFAESMGEAVSLSPSCPQATADSTHAAVVRLAELLLSRIQQAIACSTTSDYIDHDNYYTVLEVFQWDALREFARSCCGGCCEYRGLVDEYTKAANRREITSDSRRGLPLRDGVSVLVAEPTYSFEDPDKFFWDGNESVELPSLQYKLLKHMLAHRTSTIQGLADVVWGSDATEIRDAAVKDTVSRLNERLAEAGIPLFLAIEQGHVVLSFR